MPRDIPLVQYTAYSPERLPYSQETAPTVSLAYPAYPSFRQSIPMVPSVHSLQESPRGHTDYKTTRLQILSANRKHNKMPRGSKIQRKSPEEANTEKSLAEANQQTNKWGLYVASANKGSRG